MNLLVVFETLFGQKGMEIYVTKEEIYSLDIWTKENKLRKSKILNLKRMIMV